MTRWTVADPEKPPRQSRRTRMMIATERMMWRKLRAMERRDNTTGRKKQPPKELANIRTNLGRLRALLHETGDR